MEPLPLSFESVGRNFGKVQALSDLGMDILPGQIYGLVGENGAGKTTALSLAVGLLKPTSGRVRMFGHDPEKDPEKAKRDMGFLPDRPHVPPRLTGREYLRFVAALWGQEPQAADNRAKSLIERLSLSEVYDARVDSYSHGMRQKLVLASQLCHQPKLFLLDEPMVGLDVRSGRVLRTLLEEMASQGTAILISSHSLNLVEKLCHRVGVLRRGKMVFEGTVSEIVEKYAAGQDLEEALLRVDEDHLPELRSS